MEILKVSPLLLLSRFKSDVEVRDFCNSVLPYSVGIETESKYLHDKPFKLQETYTLNVRVDAEEQRFRIPNGYKGLIALELMCNDLKRYLALTKSGNHYHIDCSDNFNYFTGLLAKDDEEKERILKELDTWGYVGNYNKRQLTYNKGSWVAMRSMFNTLEFRTGELSIAYDTIFKRITHASQIVKDSKAKYGLIRPVIYDDKISEDTIIDSVKYSSDLYIKYIREVKLNGINVADKLKPTLEYVQNKTLTFY